MDKDQFPGIFIHSVFLSCVTGIGCALITVIVFLVTDDRTLLLLGGISSVFCIGKGLMLCRTVKHKKYEILEGICYHADYPMKRPYPKIRIEQENGQSLTLLLNRHQKIIHGFITSRVPSRIPKNPFGFRRFKPMELSALRRLRAQTSTQNNFFLYAEKSVPLPYFLSIERITT